MIIDKLISSTMKNWRDYFKTISPQPLQFCNQDSRTTLQRKKDSSNLIWTSKIWQKRYEKNQQAILHSKVKGQPQTKLSHFWPTNNKLCSNILTDHFLMVVRLNLSLFFPLKLYRYLIIYVPFFF